MNMNKINVIDSDVAVSSIIEDVLQTNTDEGFYICDIGSVVRQHELWTRTMPRIKTYYAIKCNNSEPILLTLASLGVNFDCASMSEIKSVLSLNVSPDRIIFSNTIKPRPHLQFANESGVRLTTVDNESELHKIKLHMPDAQILLRIRCDDPSATYKLGIKFGCDPLKEGPKLLKVAKDSGLDLIGIHFHIGSNFTDPQYFRTALEHSRKLFDLGTALGLDMNIVDIGGGFTGTSVDKFRNIGDVINQALRDLFPDPGVNVIAEPGRFYVENCCTLLTNITSVRKTEKEDEKTGEITEHNMYYIDDGIYGSFVNVIYNEPYYPIPLKSYKRESLVSSSVWGPTCDCCDYIVKDCQLPPLAVGDWLKFENMGAYSVSCASSFNGFPLPQTHYVAHKSEWSKLNFPLAEEESPVRR